VNGEGDKEFNLAELLKLKKCGISNLIRFSILRSDEVADEF
jgi:hypothetical protein